MAAIVLAGGHSRRMGRDKALLPWGGGTLIAHVVGLVAAAASPVIVVVASLPLSGDLGLPPTVRLVPDLYPDTGPLGGIATGLTATPESYHLVTACDMPELRPAVLRHLLTVAEGADGAVPEIAGRLEPLCAVYHTRCLPSLVGRIRAGRLALQQAVRALPVRFVGDEELRRLDPDLATFTNVNTPDELSALENRTDG